MANPTIFLQCTRSKGLGGNIGRVVNTSTGSVRPPEIWRGNDTTFSVGIFADAETPDDLSDMASVTLLYQDEPTSETAYASESVSSGDITDTITTSDFWAGTEAHFTVKLDAADTNPSLGGSNSKAFWLVIKGVRNNGDEVTFGAGRLTIYEDDNDSTPGAPTGPDPAISAGTATGLAEAAIVSNIGTIHTGAIAGGSRTGTVEWGETLAEAPDATEVGVFVVQPTDLAERAGDTRITAITTTDCTVETASNSHASAISVWVMRRPAAE